jgi:hypothetical protein
MDADGTRAPGAPADEAARRRRLAQLGAEVARLRGRLVAAQTELRELLGHQATRPLSADEARRVARLRWESEALRLELTALRGAFERLRVERPAQR